LKPLIVILFSINQLSAQNNNNNIDNNIDNNNRFFGKYQRFDYHSLSYSFSIGHAFYFGDIGCSSNDIKCKLSTINPSFKLGLDYRFSNFQHLELFGNIYFISAKDALGDNDSRTKRNFNFNGTYTDIGLSLITDFISINKLESKSTKITPYVSIGISKLFLDPNPEYDFLEDYSNPNGILFIEKVSKQNVWTFPIGFGLKYFIKKNINMAFEVSTMYLDTDFIDGASQLANPNTNDYIVLLNYKLFVRPSVTNADKRRKRYNKLVKKKKNIF
jgi:hypothetical protein